MASSNFVSVIGGDARIFGSLGVGASLSNATIPSNSVIIDNKLGIGTSNPTYSMDVIGNARIYNGSWMNPSANGPSTAGLFIQANLGSNPMVTDASYLGMGQLEVASASAGSNARGITKMNIGVWNGSNTGPGSDFGFLQAVNRWNYAADIILQPSSASVGIGKKPDSSFKLDVNGALQATSFTGNGSALTNLSVSALKSTGQGVSIQGNFGQWEAHGTYSNLNTAPNYWGWNFSTGSTNAPNTSSTQWYRQTVSLGSPYNIDQYNLEIACPRYSIKDNGQMYVRTLDDAGATRSGWVQVGSKILGEFTATSNAYINRTVIYDDGTNLRLVNSNVLASQGTSFALYQGTGGDTVINSASGQNLAMKIGNVEYFTLSSSGQIGMGTTSPQGKLHVFESTGSTGTATTGSLVIEHGNSNGSSTIIFPSRVNRGSDYAYIKYDDHNPTGYFALTGTGVTGENARLTIGLENDIANAVNAEHMVLKGMYGIAYDAGRHYFLGGNVGIDTSAPSYKLHVVGDIYASGNITAFSDSNYKKNLQVISSPMEKIQELTGFTYEFVDDQTSTRYAGLLAQDVLKVLPEVVMQDQEGKLSLAYGNMAGLFVEAFKEQQAQIQKLQAEVASLKHALQHPGGLAI